MERIEADLTVGEEWQNSLNATCNRLSTQYLNLLKAAAASGMEQQQQGQQHNHNTGRGPHHQIMKSLQDPPPPSLAAAVSSSALQSQLASENICTATCQLLSCIRQLRLSILLMDEETIRSEEEYQVHCVQEGITRPAQEQANQLEQEWFQYRQNELSSLLSESEKK